MKKTIPTSHFLLLTSYLLFLTSLPTFAQSTKDTTGTYDEALTIVEQMPEMPGGTDSLVSFLKHNVTYPKAARKSNVSGTVYVQFIIDRTGKVAHVQVVKGVSKELDEEAVRVVQAMPAWKPGYQSGVPVDVRFNLPIKFTLQ